MTLRSTRCTRRFSLSLSISFLESSGFCQFSNTCVHNASRMVDHPLHVRDDSRQYTLLYIRLTRTLSRKYIACAHLLWMLIDNYQAQPSEMRLMLHASSNHEFSLASRTTNFQSAHSRIEYFLIFHSL